MAEDEGFKAIARMSYDMFVELVAVGFSEGQALKFVALFFSASNAFEKGMPSAS